MHGSLYGHTAVADILCVKCLVTFEDPDGEKGLR